MLFKDITGLKNTKDILLNAVKNNHVAHAQLFLGGEGSGNLALALAYVTYIFCEDPQENDACGRCASCLKMSKLIHPDLHFIFPVSSVGKLTKPRSQDFLKEWRTFLENPFQNLSDWLGAIGAESKQPSIGAEEGRGIVSTLSLKPFEAEYKVLLMWLPEYMNITAANAILKILEEPPSKTIFLLISENVEQMLVTILSRVQILKVPQFEDTDVKNYLIEKYATEENRAIQLANLAEGNLRKALLLLHEVQDDNHVVFRDWMRLCYTKNYTELVKWADDFAAKTKETQRNLLQYGLNMCREALVWQFAGEEIIRLEGDGLEFVQGFAKVINERNAEYLYHFLNEALANLQRNASAKIVFLDTSLKIAQVIKLK